MSEAALPNALENENGDERPTIDFSAVEQPPEDWAEGEDYQLHRALEVLRTMTGREQASLN